MRRGTTPTHKFKTDADLTEATVLYITYQQDGETVLEKTLEDCTITPCAVSVTLTQAETLAFSTAGYVSIQIRAGFADGSRVASSILKISVGEILKDGEI